MKTYCHTTYISYIANERLQGEEQVHSKNYPLEMHLSHTKMRLKNAPQKQKFIIAKAISKIAKVKTNNILFNKNFSKLGKANARF